MRVTRLVFVAMLLTLAAGTATAQQVRSNGSNQWRDDSQSMNGAKQVDNGMWTGRPQDSRRNADATPDVCLSMHTLVVARDDKHSDATRLVAQHTCTPARQFQTKSAVGNGSPSLR